MAERLERAFDAAAFADELHGTAKLSVTERSFSPQEIFAALHRHGVDYVAIGGIAANAHGSRRLYPRRRHHPGARRNRNYERLAAALDELGAPASVVDSGFRDLDPRDAFDLARATILKLPTAAGDLDVLNRALGAPPHARSCASGRSRSRFVARRSASPRSTT